MKYKFKAENFIEETVYPRLELYEATDFIGRPMNNLAIELYTEDGEPFATITKSFGEFIGTKNCAYIDINNCPFATNLLKLGVANDTGLTKSSGFCKYPLWSFSEDFLKDIGEAKYDCYSTKFDSYMGFDCDDEDMDEDEDEYFEQTM